MTRVVEDTYTYNLALSNSLTRRIGTADYRMFVLEVYVYLRNAHKEKFQDPSFTRSLLYNTGRIARNDELSPPEAPSGAATPTGRCVHCRRNGAHPGTTREDCPLKVLPTRKAHMALANLSGGQARTVTRTLLAALTATPAGDVDAMIATARAAV